MPTSPDDLFGQLAVKAGYLSQGQVENLLRLQRQGTRGVPRMTLGELCQAKKVLTSEQVQRLLLAQEYAVLRDEDRRLGALAIEKGLASEEEVRVALEEQKRIYQEERALPARVGEILVDMGVLSEKQLADLREGQVRADNEPARTSTSHPREGQPVGSKADGSEPSGWLVQTAGEGTGRRFPIRRKALLGRDPSNEIPIPDAASSRQHARVEFVPVANQHVVVDLNSKNGTLVNGAPINEATRLNSGDSIRIGDTVLRYSAGPNMDASTWSPDETKIRDMPPMASQRSRATAAMQSVAQPSAAPPTAKGGTVSPTAVGPNAMPQVNPSAATGDGRPCANCGARVPAKVAVCPKCYADAKTGLGLSCGSCGGGVPPGAAACPGCGAKF